MTVWSGALAINPDATVVKAVHAKEAYNDKIRLYRECKSVEKALLRHTQNTLELKYIEPLLSKDTGLIEDDLLILL